jgi:hypothetical protein
MLMLIADQRWCPCKAWYQSPCSWTASWPPELALQLTTRSSGISTCRGIPLITAKLPPSMLHLEEVVASVLMLLTRGVHRRSCLGQEGNRTGRHKGSATGQESPVGVQSDEQGWASAALGFYYFVDGGRNEGRVAELAAWNLRSQRKILADQGCRRWRVETEPDLLTGSAAGSRPLLQICVYSNANALARQDAKRDSLAWLVYHGLPGALYRKRWRSKPSAGHTRHTCDSSRGRNFQRSKVPLSRRSTGRALSRRTRASNLATGMA